MFEDVPLLLAFTGGLIATVNPCGVAMLPAYLSFFLGMEGGPADARAASAGAGPALRVGATVAAGFLLVFGSAWVLLSLGLRVVIDVVPWAALIVGVLVLVLGVQMLRGRPLPIRLPTPGRAADGRSTGAILLFGSGYAIASLSCTLPVFLAVVAGTVTRVGVAQGAIAFGIYSVGMLLPLLALTVSIAFGRDALVRKVRRVGGVVTRAGGVLLLLAGLYILAYWVTQLSGASGGPLLTIVVGVERAAAGIADLMATRPWLTASVAVVLVGAASAAAAVTRRRRHPVTPSEVEERT